ncbi:MAG TPA: hypothetical protein PKK11_05980 [Methanothrix sp.]|nr:hypothetical protein [Methanothrix sp.]HPT19465.1 hypothetical protein [Methanothrix sp.]
MRYISLILLSLLSIAFLAILAQGINWDDPTNDADEMISSGETQTITPPAGQAATPKLSRDSQKNKSSLEWTMPSTLSGNTDSAKASRAAAEATGESESDTTTSADETTVETASTESVAAGSTAATAATADTELPPAQTETAVMTVGGSWSLLLNDTEQKDLAVSLFQKDGDVFGAGKMRAGESLMDVALSGTVDGSRLELNVVSLGTISLYKLDLDVSGDAATGQFLAISTSGETWTGNAEGQKTA